MKPQKVERIVICKIVLADAVAGNGRRNSRDQRDEKPERKSTTTT
jgi:hypothetical protein